VKPTAGLTIGLWIAITLAPGITVATDHEEPAVPGVETLQAVTAFFDYDARIPLQARIVERIEDDETVRDKVIFRGVRGFWVPGYLEIPKDGAAVHPCVLLLHGWSWSKESWYDDDNDVYGGNLRRALLDAGYAIFALDAQIHGDRIAENDYAVVNIWPGEGTTKQRNLFTLAEICEQTVRDYRRSLDYLQMRPEIDVERIGAFGYSMGAWQVVPLAAVEPRVRVAVAAALPTERPQYDPVAPRNYAMGITQPFLLQIGREDVMASVAGGEQVHELLTSSTKQLIWYPSGHLLPVTYVPDAVAWFRRHL
jgi:dienelactone hydrolase